MNNSFVYNHFQKTWQLARGEEKIELTVDIHCIGISGTTAHGTHPEDDLLPCGNEGIGLGKNVPQLKCGRIPCILPL